MTDICPFCASQHLTPNSAAPHWRQGDYHMMTCQDCGSDTAWPRVAATDDVYDHGMPANRWEFRQVLRDCRDGGGPGQILDVGSGKGDFLLMAQSEGVSAIGIDFSAENIAVAQRRGVECSQRDLRDFEADRRFRFITAFHVIEHLADPKGFLEMLRGRIENDGAVYLSFPNVDRGTLRFMRDFGDFPPYHLNRVTVEGMHAVAERAGMTVVARRIEPRDLNWRYATSLAVNHMLDTPRLRRALAKNQMVNLGLKALVALILQPTIVWRLLKHRSDPGFTVLYRLELADKGQLDVIDV